MNDVPTYDELSAALADMGVVQSQMFGMPIWKVGTKAIGGPWHGAMVFKLSGETLDEALALPGAKLFDPMGGRPMKQWVQLGPEHAAVWLGYAESAAKDVLQQT